jgi:hypothetical protein
MADVVGVAAIFDIKTHALNVTKTGTGTGTVVSDPAGIDCGTACSWPYGAGTPVTLTATADAHASFTGWDGACTGTGPCSVTMDAAKNLMATFTLNNYTLTVNTAGTGSGTVGGGGSYAYNTLVTPTATANSGSTFAGWEPASCGSSFALTTDTRCTATFTLIPVPTLSIDNVSATEGQSGSKYFDFTVSLDLAASGSASVSFATANGTATTGNKDYKATSGILSFEPGQTSKTIRVTVQGDTKIENDETFLVNLTQPNGVILGVSQGIGTILNDDWPRIRINNVSRAEGNSGTTSFDFTVSLSAASPGPVTVYYATANGSASADSDYYAVATPTQITFSPGQKSRTISINVRGDTTKESNETFFVNLGSSSGASIADGQGMGTIKNDDR